MNLQPQSPEDLARTLAEASRAGPRIGALDLSRLNRLIEHKPEDMTATVESGMSLMEFERRIKTAGQWLPLDPAAAERISIADLLARNLSGPRRLGYGTVRDYLIGAKVVLADGTIIKPGGKVVKNVAGYDLCKLFIGARHSLGIIVEATFKLRPLPEAEIILERTFDSISDVHAVARAVLDSPVDPMILDAYRMRKLTLVCAVAGTREDVEYQRARLNSIAKWDAGSTRYEEEFWRDPEMVNKSSVLPSRLAQMLEGVSGKFVARYGNGTIYSRDAQRSETASVADAPLQRRVKTAFDPLNILPECSF
jgi:FAD/FMN-containing dehydrogenase